MREQHEYSRLTRAAVIGIGGKFLLRYWLLERGAFSAVRKAFLSSSNPARRCGIIAGQPACHHVSRGKSRLRAPFGIGSAAMQQRGKVERRHHRTSQQASRCIRVGRQSQQPQHIGAHIARLPGPRPEPRRARRGAAQQEPLPPHQDHAAEKARHRFAAIRDRQTDRLRHPKAGRPEPAAPAERARGPPSGGCRE